MNLLCYCCVFTVERDVKSDPMAAQAWEIDISQFTNTTLKSTFSVCQTAAIYLDLNAALSSVLNLFSSLFDCHCLKLQSINHFHLHI